MKIVINVPDDLKNQINDDNYESIIRWYSTSLYCAIKESIVLPKGHDRLIYADDVKQNHRRWLGYLDGDMIARLNIAIDKYVPTIIEADRDSLEWLGKNCKDCGNENCKKLGGLTKGYDCALWQAKQEDNEGDEEKGLRMKKEDAIYFLGQLTTLLGDPRYVQALREAIKALSEEGSMIDRALQIIEAQEVYSIGDDFGSVYIDKEDLRSKILALKGGAE